MTVMNAQQEKKINSQISKQLEAEKLELTRHPISKLLLLGPGDAGKTTILKQMKILHGDGFSPQEREDFKLTVYNNIVTAVQILLEACSKLQIQIEAKCKLDVDYLLSLQTDKVQGLDANAVRAIKHIWMDPGVQTCYIRSNEFTFQDTFTYFMENITRLTSNDYVPTDKDILMLRKRTTQMSSTDFRIKGALYKVIDVGGQKSYRGQWAKFFDDAKAVLFVVSIAGYDQFMEEDPSTNKMVDAMTLYEETVSNPLLKNVKTILLFNKTDLLEKKLPISSLRKYFTDLSTKRDETKVETANAYFKYKFNEIQKRHCKTKLFTHFTNSTDTELMKNIIDAIMQVDFNGLTVREIIINFTLHQAGLIE